MVVISWVIIVFAPECLKTFDMVSYITMDIEIVSYCNNWNKMIKSIPDNITQVGPCRINVFRLVLESKF